ncbi:MAG: hypothetical protein A3K19_17080 [Lentisphaerae bacterium RIFOXYB12_FULL_65_16]|nr:MAG: hypothetical protein A3K18_03695 [Lentisphaerae bacterium RIFOXYA12_64_32]OGV87699.1 MAG: hypothetical protein A3K19_17080 [Lentisphaerae bacterium RIFOXYB12_FULL_65_16]
MHIPRDKGLHGRQCVRTAGVLLSLILGAGGLSGCATRPPLEDKPPTVCGFSTGPIVIDGALDDAAWQQAPVISDFTVPVTHVEPVNRTEARILWDQDCLYVAFKTYDQDIWGLFTARDAATYNEDVLEIFFKTAPAMEPYYNFEINALGTVYDAFQYRARAGMGHRWSKWDCAGLKVATQVQGTLNNYDDVDEYWQLEVAIPFAALPTLQGRAPQAGDHWSFHLARYDHSVYLEAGQELVSCARLTQRSFHRYEDWLVLVFAGKP